MSQNPGTKPNSEIIKIKKKKSSKKKKTLVVKSDDESKVDPRFLLPVEKKFKPKHWELPNRKGFVNWFDSTYSKYAAKKGAVQKKSDKFDFFMHQKLIRDYLQYQSPYRGILLYHGLGVGKTCASIAIAEGFKGKQKIKVLLNKSLKQNFIVNLMFCGDNYFRTNQHWVEYHFKKDDPMLSYAKELGLPMAEIRKTGKAWFIDFDKPANYNSLSTKDQLSLQNQINNMIKNRYDFIHLDGLNEKRLKTMIGTNPEDNYFNDCVLIIDEVHNLTNAIAKDNPGVRGKYLQQLIMEAQNLRCVFLSGTPMINNLFEAGKLFNLLRGYIIAFKFTIKPKTTSALALKSLQTLIKNHPLVDQCIVKSKDTIILTRNPNDFEYITGEPGIKRVAVGQDMSDNIFRQMIEQLLDSKGYSSSYSYNRHTALPNNEADFMRLFYNEDKNRIKNPELFKSRIMGLVSYYRTQSPELLPTVTVNDIVKVNMSDYQFMKYAQVRKAEIEQDKGSKKKSKPKPKAKKDKANDDKKQDSIFDAKSSYRAFSRMHCSFVFPETIPRPYLKDFIMGESSGNLSKIFAETAVKLELIQIEKTLGRDDLLSVYEDQIKAETSEETPEDEKQQMKLLTKKYENAKAKTLRQLERESVQHLIVDEEEKLLKFSPKYNQIVKKIGECPGLAFVYTEYKTLEGIAVFKVVLKANGYSPFLLKKNDAGQWLVDTENPDFDASKPNYAFWGEDAEQSDLIRKIYNNEYDELPTQLRDQVKRMGDNLHGKVIKVLMTTKSGAEGIDLKNVRQVHVVEPYWNPVRVKQVKGRAVRVNSHVQLPKDERKVEIYTYLSEITPAQKKSDKTIKDDKDGQSSDEALFELSQKKLQVMEELLRIIKEVSVDCSLNIAETYSDDEPFKCLNFGTKLTRENYSYVPNITDEHVDSEKRRRIKTVDIKLKKIKIQGKEYYLVDNPDDDGSLIYPLNEDITKTGKLGKPIGTYKLVDGKPKVTLKQKKKKTKKANNTEGKKSSKKSN